jgi:hypothetical protein
MILVRSKLEVNCIFKHNLNQVEVSKVQAPQYCYRERVEDGGLCRDNWKCPSLSRVVKPPICGTYQLFIGSCSPSDSIVETAFIQQQIWFSDVFSVFFCSYVP